MADETTSIAGDPLGGNAGATGAAGGGTEDAGAKRSASDTIREEAAKYADQAKEHILGFAGTGKERATSALDEVAERLARSGYLSAAEVAELVRAGSGPGNSENMESRMSPVEKDVDGAVSEVGPKSEGPTPRDRA